MWETKASMFARGKALMERFCAANEMPVPAVAAADPKDWRLGTCAYYRANVVHIVVDKCAAVGYAGMQWSFPGHSVDRTPYGVIAHELGHHADVLKSTKVGRYYGNFSIEMRAVCGEAPLTSYCPDDAEWFAEMFRLFVTNPDLLAKLRPITHENLCAHFRPVFEDSWRERLQGAPDRTLLSIERKLAPKAIAKRPRINAA